MPQGSATRVARLLPEPPDEPAIPDKLYFRIGEVSRLTHTQAYVLRFWETEFPTLRPVKSKSGHRLYRRKDVEMIFTIRRLLYDNRFTIEGARRHLAAGEKSPTEQAPLFQPPVDQSELKAIRRELQTILATLARKP
jgi:DNA-binding transcriptional MerR regulator